MTITIDTGIGSARPLVRRSPDCTPEDMRSLVKDSFCSMDYTAIPGSTPATSRLLGVGLGAVNVFRHDSTGERVGCRSHAHIRQHWVDDFVISMPLNARVTTRQGGHLAQLDADSFVILSTTRPFDALFTGRDTGSLSSAFLVRINGSLLRQRAPAVDRYCGMPLQVGAGAGRIMRGMFELALMEGAALLDQRQIDRFSGMLLDAVTNVVADLFADAETLAPRKTSYEKIREAAIAYIHSQLSNPNLTVNEIAHRCGVSTRYLQVAFADAAMSAAGYIREARLVQSRQSLRDPATRDMSVIDIAMRWGFNDAPYFSRAYKARFGRSPSTDRR